MKRLLILSLLTGFVLAQTPKKDDYLVGITAKLSHIITSDSGQKVKIERIQDVGNILTDDFTKTSRSCPPFCIQPTKVDKRIKNIGELELIKFIDTKISSNRGVLIDTRLKSWFELETIPSAINLPFTVVENASKEKMATIFKIFGMKIKKDGSWDFSKVKELAIFDNGVWCAQASHFIPNILKYGYPSDKIYYYREGLQGWKLLGLTTLVHKEIVKK
ncbi:hypothetical protein MNB_SV-14-773 [hydrothermal vent metagenome]|uniref:Rhodanese domain-containing protein n=1 Tax=hydrothermal vent metagenome TaxID=652676 RepID=A0A1W1CJ31_9ZZZZ